MTDGVRLSGCAFPLDVRGYYQGLVFVYSGRKHEIYWMAVYAGRSAACTRCLILWYNAGVDEEGDDFIIYRCCGLLSGEDD